MGVPFFSRGILTSYSCSDVKEMDRKTWCTCKVVVFVTKTYCFFCHSRCRRGRRIRFLKLTRLEGWSTMAGKLFSIKPILGYHIVHMTAFAAWSSGGVKVRSLLFHVFFFLTQCHVLAACQHKDPLSSSKGILFFYMSTFLTKQK